MRRSHFFWRGCLPLILLFVVFKFGKNKQTKEQNKTNKQKTKTNKQTKTDPSIRFQNDWVGLFDIQWFLPFFFPFLFSFFACLFLLFLLFICLFFCSYHLTKKKKKKKKSKRLRSLWNLMVLPIFFFFAVLVFFVLVMFCFVFSCMFVCLFVFVSALYTWQKNGDGPFDFKKTEVSLKSNGPSPFLFFFSLKVGRLFSAFLVVSTIYKHVL